MEAVAACQEHLIALLPRPPIRSRKYPKRSMKPGKPLGFRRTASPYPDEKGKKNSLKMRDRCGDVYENKGPEFCEQGQSGNVAENKGSCALKAGMLLKRSMFGLWSAAACCRFSVSSLLEALPEASSRRGKAAASCRTPKTAEARAFEATGDPWGAGKVRSPPESTMPKT